MPGTYIRVSGTRCRMFDGDEHSTHQCREEGRLVRLAERADKVPDEQCHPNETADDGSRGARREPCAPQASTPR